MPSSPGDDDTKLKRHNKVLKLAVREEQERTKALEGKVRAMELEGVSSTEEIRMLRDREDSLRKRVAMLQQELETQKKNAASSWGVPGLSGWGSTVSKVDAERLQKEHATMEQVQQDMMDQVAQVQNQNFELTAERDTLKIRVKKQADDHVAKLAALGLRKKEELLAASLRTERLTSERDEVISRAEADAKLMVTVREELASLQEEHRKALSSAETEQGALQRSIEQYGQDNERLRESLATATAALSAEEITSMQLREQCRDLESSLEAAENANQTERAVVGELRARVGDLEKAVTAAKDEAARHAKAAGEARKQDLLAAQLLSYNHQHQKQGRESIPAKDACIGQTLGATERQRLIASGTLFVGLRVERRVKRGEWGAGFVTALEPTLKVTRSSTNPEDTGYEWPEVRLIHPVLAGQSQTGVGNCTGNAVSQLSHTPALEEISSGSPYSTRIDSPGTEIAGVALSSPPVSSSSPLLPSPAKVVGGHCPTSSAADALPMTFTASAAAAATADFLDSTGAFPDTR